LPKVINLHVEKSVIVGTPEHMYVVIPCKERVIREDMFAMSTDDIVLKENQIGLIEGKHSLSKNGVVIVGGIVHENWIGQLEVKVLALEGAVELKRGDEIGHLIIFESD